MQRTPLAAIITKQHVPWCADCARHHFGDCADTDVSRDQTPKVARNMGKVDDDDGSISVVTDGSTTRLVAAGRHKECRALGDMLVTYADGTTKVVPKRKRGENARTVAKRAREAKRVSEAEAYAQKQREKLSLDEIRALNGL